MQQRDLLKDQIEQIGKTMGKVIARFLGLKNRGNLEEAISVTNTALNDLLDFDVPAFLNCSEEEVSGYVLARLKTADQIEQLAEYLIELGDQKRMKKEGEAQHYYLKAMSLYELIATLTETFNFVRSKKEYALRVRLEKGETS